MNFMYSFFLFLYFIINNNVTGLQESDPGTIAHVFLDIEKEFGADIRHFTYMDDLISRAKARINIKTDYITVDAVQTLQAVHLLLKEEGFVYKQNFLMNTGLDRKEIDCDTYSAIYTSISEALRLPVIPVCAPNHSFLRFIFKDGSYLNWDPVDGKHYPDAFYIKRLNIASKSIQEGVYLKSLSRKEFTGVEYNNIGAYLLSGKRYREAIPYFSMAISLYPKYSSAYHNRGTSYYAIKQLENAFSDLNYANALDPNQASTHNTLGDIYFDRKDYINALDHYTESIRLDPKNYAPYYSIGLLMKLAGKPEAEDWLRKSEDIKRKYGN